MSDQQEHDERNKIEWMGIDGFLCFLFVFLSAFIGYCLINNVDVVIGKVIPYGIALATTAIFIKYLTEVIGFSKGTMKD
ncbi:MAG: hypothetical protein LBT31_03735 [Synergistaceae bacterium]|jgi:hypothetical protein|nr:hypothetical protein [Synergistaceae bacterium]